MTINFNIVAFTRVIPRSLENFTLDVQVSLNLYSFTGSALNAKKIEDQGFFSAVIIRVDVGNTEEPESWKFLFSFVSG